MIWPFTRKKDRPVSGEIQAAQAAEQRAEATIQQVTDRTGEVNVYYTNLRARRFDNNFGDALVVAMGKRQL